MYRKYTADKIFDGHRFLEPGQVLITSKDGLITDLLPVAEAGDDIENLPGVLCPGLINAHCHIELSHLKNLIKPSTGLVAFVQQVLGHRARQAAIAEMQLAAIELYRSGTVAIGDICNTAVSVPLKTDSPIHWQNFIEVSGFVPAGAAARLAEVELLQHQFEKSGLKPTTISPHSPYSVSPELFRRINMQTQSQLISIHNQEAAAENELYQRKTGAFLDLYRSLGINIDAFSPTGKSSLQSWLPHFNQDQKIIAVHNTFINADDIDFAKKYVGNKTGDQNGIAGLFFCVCINANLYIENKLPPLQLMMDSGFPIVLGTDSYASNRQLDLMTEINTIQQHFPMISLEEILKWATSNGALALGIADKFGSFKKGKKPGIVNIVGDEARLLDI